MELSLFLAQLIGLTYVVFAVVAIARPTLVQKAMRGVAADSFSTLFAGIVALVVGLAIVLSHNVWDGSWRVIVTIMGWASLFKGVAYLFAPESLFGLGSSLLENTSRMRLILVVALALGAYLAMKGFGY